MRAQLIVQNGSAEGSFELEPGQSVTLGRSRENGIVIKDEHASRQHARVSFEAGRWLVADLESRNGTLLNGRQLRKPAALSDGSEIRIGAIVVRVHLSSETPTAHPGPGTDVAAPLTASSSTQLQADELTALCAFMAAAVDEESVNGLLRRALKCILRQTGSAIGAYMIVDGDDAQPKLVLPEAAEIDREVSKLLTQGVRRQGRMVWLARLRESLPRGHKSAVTDALGLAVRSRGDRAAVVQIFKTNGAFGDRDVRFCEALVGSLAGYMQVLRVRRSLQAENTRLRSRRAEADVLIGESPELQKLRHEIARVAPERFTVLVTGDTGVGKELVAVAVHRQSPRAGGPLVVVNCAAIPSAMMEVELFGACRGAWAGADRDYPGLFQQADDGTLLFDEIAELSVECQAKLLRVIEGKPFRPLGSPTEIKPDVRIIAATNCDLEKATRTGKFRPDLYFRLRSLTIAVPPLREHASDIPAIAEDYVHRLSVECRKAVKLTPAAIEKLCNYRWPGNVRELQRVLECAVVHADGPELDEHGFALVDGKVGPSDLPIDLEAIERVWAIPEALRRANRNKTQAARMLGITRETLSKKMEKFGIGGKDEG